MDLVEVAFVDNEYEGAIIQALLEEGGIPSLQQKVGIDAGDMGYGALTGGGSRRVMVHAHRAEEARTLLPAAEVPAEDRYEPVNARYLADAQGGKLRSYGLVGGFARALLVCFGTLALAFGVFMLLQAI